MSLPVSHGPAFFSPDGARDAGEVVAARRVERERLIDDELAQSFPASDPPSWVQGVAPQPPQAGAADVQPASGEE